MGDWSGDPFDGWAAQLARGLGVGAKPFRGAKVRRGGKMFSDWHDKEPYEYEELVHETDHAWLLRIDGEELWLPKSKCNLDEQDGRSPCVWVPNWLADEKGLR